MKAEPYDAHPVWSTLEEVNSLLGGGLGVSTDEEREHVRRANSVAEYVEALRDTDPLLVEADGLTALNTQMEQLRNHLRGVGEGEARNPAHLAAAADLTPTIMSLIRANFPPPFPDEATRSAKAASTRYKNALDAEVESLREIVTGLQAELTNAAAKQAEVEAGAQQRLAELSEQIAAGETQVASLTTQLTGQIETQQITFDKEAKEREAAFEESERSRVEADQVRAAEAAEAAKAALEEQDEAARRVLQKLEDYREQAAAVVDTTSRHAITGEYGTWASLQAKAAFRWTVATVAIGIGTAAGLIVALTSAAPKESIQFTLSKLSIGVVGLIVAGYTARQASEHRKEERTAKRLALDLAALEPFLDQVDDPTELRTEVARRVFVPADPDTSEGDVRLRTRRGSLSVRDLKDLITVFRAP
jgi:hypothetical protein